MNKKIIFIFLLCIFICASLAGNAYLYFEMQKINKLYQEKQTNLKVLEFRNMFTENVLLADKEIDFDTRLTLETSVRSLNDQEIFNQWQVFTKSITKEDASVQAKKLLRILVQRTSQ